MKKTYLSNLEIADLCRGIAMMTHAGVGLGDGLSLLAEEESSDMSRILLDMGQKIDRGSKLASAMESAQSFPRYVTGMVEVGESTGRLEETLNALAQYYEDREMMDRQIRNAVMYPSILMVLMVVIIVVLLSRVLPMFEAAYESLGAQLTGVADGLLLLGRILNSMMPLLCLLLGIAVGALLLFTLSQNVREAVLKLWYRFRGDRGAARKINDSRFAQAMAMGMRSGFSVEEAMEKAAELLRDVPQAYERCQNCLEQLRLGGDLADVLRENGIFPAASCRLLALGLKGGKGDAAMEEISRRLAEEANQDLERKVGRIEPAMVLTTSLLVGVILLTVMLPLMNIMSVIG